MSIIVSKLVKTFGLQKAVNDISFTANKGEILGFLGPNGAGKSTTMKMITGALMQDSGSIEVCGIDTLNNAIEVKKKIGYLAESNALYKDMYVREYLTFMASIHQTSDSKTKVKAAIDITGLSQECHKKIGELSKGYKQRVGLAQAFIHDPEVLILDEPTSGLDPNQIVDIRNLILELGKSKTVILSTHIMQEVHAICHRVIIMNKGKLVANTNVNELNGSLTKQINLEVEFANKPSLELIKDIPGFEHLKHIAGNTFMITFKGDRDCRRDLFEFASANNIVIVEMKTSKDSLETIFQKLTKDIE